MKLRVRTNVESPDISAAIAIGTVAGFVLFAMLYVSFILIF